jgi:hypothetical protein
LNGVYSGVCIVSNSESLAVDKVVVAPAINDGSETDEVAAAVACECIAAVDSAAVVLIDVDVLQEGTVDMMDELALRFDDAIAIGTVIDDGGGCEIEKVGIGIDVDWRLVVAAW